MESLDRQHTAHNVSVVSFARVGRWTSECVMTMCDPCIGDQNIQTRNASSRELNRGGLVRLFGCCIQLHQKQLVLRIGSRQLKELGGGGVTSISGDNSNTCNGFQKVLRKT